MAEYRLLALTNPVAGREDEYNAWYDGRHLDDVLAVPGFKRAQRFVVDDAMPGATTTHKYLAIYEFETDDLDATMRTFFAFTGSDRMPISDALDGDARPTVYRVLGPAKEAAISPAG